MTREIVETGKLGSYAEDIFLELFFDLYGAEKTKYLFIQYPSVDIYGNSKFIDFALESDNMKIAIEIDGENYHNQERFQEINIMMIF